MHFDAQDVQNYIKSVVSTHEGKQLSKKPREAVSSAVSDLVPRSRFGGSRAKTGGGGRGEGKGEEETRFGKIRLRGPESGPRVNCACSKSCVQYSHRVDNALRFAFENAVH